MRRGLVTGEVLELFQRALSEPGARRPAFLDEACARDPELRERIEHLLRFSQTGDGFLERSPIRTDSPDDVATEAYIAGRSIGAYRLLHRLGAGGTAEVWLAERIEGGFRQQAALKLIPNARGSIRERFASERGILASLVHPSIARLYDGGVDADGSAYMVMEYVEGDDLVAYCDKHRCVLASRLALFLQVCDAVAFAHTRLVVHRDIKPANILVSTDGKAKLLDFGIAKLLDADHPGDVTHTLHLSPAYAAPEQLAGGPVGTAADVYALGVTLFELLTGRLPWSGDAASLATAVKRLLDASLPPPSRAAMPDGPVSKRALQGDLDAIVARALRREPSARYADARALADDIRRHLEHRPVHARADARNYVLRRFARRNWFALASAAAVFTAMAIALGVISWQARQTRVQAQRAEAVQSFMVDLFRTNSSKQADPVKARQTTARELLDIGAQRIENGLGDAPENKLALLRVFAELYYDLGLSSDEERLRRQAVTFSRSVYGADSPQLAENLIDLSSATFASGLVKEAKPLLEEARAVLDRRGDTSSALRGRLMMISTEYFQSTNLTQAYSDAEQALSIFSGRPESRDLYADALYMAGLIATRIGKPEEAIDSLQRAIAISSEIDGVPNPSLSIFFYQLAESQSDALLPEAAIASARQSLDYSLKINGEDHIDTFRARTMLGRVLADSEKISEGMKLVQQATQDTLKLRGPDDAFHTRAALTVRGRAQVQAGDLEAGLADSLAALAILRKQMPGLLAEAVVLEDIAVAQIEADRFSEAFKALDEAAIIRVKVNAPARDLDAYLRVRAALDADRIADARSLFTKTVIEGSNPRSMEVASSRRELLEAQISLQSDDNTKAAALAADVGKRARASELAPYLHLLIADSELTEGLARLRGGNPQGACPILSRAFATRSNVLLPKSPKIAEAGLALAECELALGKRSEAANMLAQAEAIESQHASLSGRYRKPLERLRAQLRTP
ncbi:MAG: protein kinase [Dokdonella sp.]